MNTAEIIFEEAQRLPEADARKVLAFITHLRSQQNGYAVLPSLEKFCQGLPTQSVSAGEFCRTIRDEERY